MACRGYAGPHPRPATTAQPRRAGAAPPPLPPRRAHTPPPPARQAGGGSFNYGGTLTITDSEFHHNSAQHVRRPPTPHRPAPMADAPPAAAAPPPRPPRAHPPPLPARQPGGEIWNGGNVIASNTSVDRNTAQASPAICPFPLVSLVRSLSFSCPFRLAPSRPLVRSLAPACTTSRRPSSSTCFPRRSAATSPPTS